MSSEGSAGHQVQIARNEGAAILEVATMHTSIKADIVFAIASLAMFKEIRRGRIRKEKCWNIGRALAGPISADHDLTAARSLDAPRSKLLTVNARYNQQAR